MGVRIFLLVCLLHLIKNIESSEEVVDLSCDQIRALVDGHNSRRLSLAQGNIPNQPAALNMKYVTWDKKLAEKAAKHSLNESGRFTTGENLYIIPFAHGELDVEAALDAWFDEHKDYTYGPITPSVFSGRPVGHYTQMVWADSVNVGCGIAKNTGGTYYVVCNYGPGGNVKNQPPYTTAGSSGELTCSGDCSKKYGDQC